MFEEFILITGMKTGFISTLTFEKAQELIIRGNIDGGMIPKVKSCITALSGGAHKTHIIDGREPTYYSYGDLQ